MEKIVFKNSKKSYFLVSVFGIAAGLLVAFFSLFPAEDLWGLAYFSSQTFAFWICTCSLIALFSEKNYVAGINVALYVFFMFYVTGIFKQLAKFRKEYITKEEFLNAFINKLSYGFVPALICFALAFALWYGRKNNMFSRIIRYLPLALIIIESADLILWFADTKQGLFMVIIEPVCGLVYAIIIIRSSRKTIKAAV